MSTAPPPRPGRQRRNRLLAGLIGLVLGGLLFFQFLYEPGQQPREYLRQAATRLPAELRQPVLELLGGAQTAEAQAVRAAGVIQADQVAIASELGGRIAGMMVAEGDSVSPGQLLVQLDARQLEAQIESAEALVAVAQAGLAQARAGARPGRVSIAQAQLAQAESARLAARQAVSDTLALVENPQEILLQIAVAQAQAVAAQHQVAQATALKDAAELGKDKFDELQVELGSGPRQLEVASGSVDDLPVEIPPEILDPISGIADGTYRFRDYELQVQGGRYTLYKWVEVDLPLELHLMPNRWWQAWVGVNAALAQQEGSQRSLYTLYSQYQHPQALEAQADQALCALAEADAQVATAKAQVAALQAGASPEQIAALEARVSQAQAAVSALQRQRDMASLFSPRHGTVISVAAHPGEVAARGATLLSIADLTRLNLVVYVPQNWIGRIRLGQQAEVMVDSFPGERFAGEVSHIADQAQFTPRNVATQEVRANLVFAVTVRIPNPLGLLKPGMPADVLLAPPEDQ